MNNFGFIMEYFMILIKSEIMKINDSYRMYSDWMLEYVVNEYIDDHNVQLYFDIRDKLHSRKLDINNKNVLVKHVNKFYENNVQKIVIYNENVKLKKYMEKNKNHENELNIYIHNK